MNHFAKALKSFNKRAVLQKAAVGKPEGSYVNKEGKTVLPHVTWDFVSCPGVALMSKPESLEDGSRLGIPLKDFFAGVDAELRMDIEAMSPGGLRVGEVTQPGVRDLFAGNHGSMRRPAMSINPIHALREHPEIYLDDHFDRFYRLNVKPCLIA